MGVPSGLPEGSLSLALGSRRRVRIDDELERRSCAAPGGKLNSLWHPISASGRCTGLSCSATRGSTSQDTSWCLCWYCWCTPSRGSRSGGPFSVDVDGDMPSMRRHENVWPILQNASDAHTTSDATAMINHTTIEGQASAGSISSERCAKSDLLRAAVCHQAPR